MIRQWRIQTKGTADLPMPEDMPVPLKEIGRKFTGASGIYFAWSKSDNVLQYVGKSKNLGMRVYGTDKHPYGDKRKELNNCLVNVVLFPENEIHLAELFYIWKLRPRMNSETKKFYAGLPETARATVDEWDPNWNPLED